MQTRNYEKTLDAITLTIAKLKVNDLQSLNELSVYLYDSKLQFVEAEKDTVEFYTYCAIQNLSLVVDECREKYLCGEMKLEEIEDKIKITWHEDYKKFKC